MQEMLREGAQLLRRLHQPLQDRIRVHLEHPRRAPDTQAFGQARDDANDELDGGALAVKDRAEGLEKTAVTSDARQFPPAAPMRIAIGAEIAPAPPSPIETIRG